MTTEKSIAMAIPKENRRVALLVLTAIGATIAECGRTASAAAAVVPEPSNDGGKLPPIVVSKEYAARLRRSVVQDIWEPDLRADLVDRCVNLVATKLVSANELRQAIAAAKEKRRRYDETGGASGSESVWKPLGAWCRGKYEAAGLGWSKTDKRLEPEPPRPRPVTMRAVDQRGNPVKISEE